MLKLGRGADSTGFLLSTKFACSTFFYQERAKSRCRPTSGSSRLECAMVSSHCGLVTVAPSRSPRSATDGSRCSPDGKPVPYAPRGLLAAKLWALLAMWTPEEL